MNPGPMSATRRRSTVLSSDADAADYRGSRPPVYHRRVDDSFDCLLTDRLVLRRFAALDAARFAAYRSEPDVARYQSWDAPYPVERAEAFIGWLAGRHPDEPGEWYQVAIAERSTPEVLDGGDRRAAAVPVRGPGQAQGVRRLRHPERRLMATAGAAGVRARGPAPP